MPEKLPNRILYVWIALFLGVALTTNAQSPDAGYLAGCAGIQKGDLRGAIDNLNAVIARNNSDGRVFIYRGQALMGLKEYADAIRDFNEANEITPGSGDIWLARAYALSGDKTQAIACLARHLGSDYRLPEDSIRKDPAFRELEGSREWFSLWDREWYTPAEKTAAEAAFYLHKGRPAEAISMLDAELSKTPTAAGLYILRGEANFSQGNHAAAIADYTTVLNLVKNNPKDNYPPLEGLPAGRYGAGGGFNRLTGTGNAYLLRGKAYLKAGRFKDAAGDLTRVLREDPASFPSYLLRAEAFAGMKTYPEAIRDIQTYLKYFENDLQAVYQCGEYYFQAEDYLNALKYFNRNLKEDPNNALYYKSRGKTYLKSATYRYAINDLSMSLDLNPDDAETWMYLGMAKIESGDRENGCSDLQKSRQMGNTEVLKYIVDSCR